MACFFHFYARVDCRVCFVHWYHSALFDHVLFSVHITCFATNDSLLVLPQCWLVNLDSATSRRYRESDTMRPETTSYSPFRLLQIIQGPGSLTIVDGSRVVVSLSSIGATIVVI